MPSDANLYGHRPAKKQRREMGLSDTLDFASQLRSLMDNKKGASSHTTSSGSGAASARPLTFSSLRKSKANDGDDDLANVRVKKRKAGAGNARHGRDERASQTGGALRFKSPPAGSAAAAALDANERDRIRRNMEAKAKRYAAMQRGDYVAREGEAAPLVDFDRKWAERKDGGDTSSDDSEDDSQGDGKRGSRRSPSASDSEDNGQDQEQVEFEDEFGRTRMMSRAEHDRRQRRRARAERSERELADLRAHPARPEGVVVGDVIQTEAIAVGGPDGSSTAEGAPTFVGTRYREDTPPSPSSHYRADQDVRVRGAAFYQFATGDEAARQEQMADLAAERKRTEAARASQHTAADARRAELEARRADMEARRKAVAERKAAKQASQFLDGLEDDLLGTIAGGGGGGSDDKKKDQET